MCAYLLANTSLFDLVESHTQCCMYIHVMPFCVSGSLVPRRSGGGGGGGGGEPTPWLEGMVSAPASMCAWLEFV